MNVHFEDLTLKSEGNSFVAYAYQTDKFTFHMHYHPEYELTYIEKGSGQRMIGDSLAHFAEGDLVLIEPDVPHTWSGNNELSSAVVIQFSRKFIEPFMRLKEFTSIKILLESLNGAFVFESDVVQQQLKAIGNLDGFCKLTSFLDILNCISNQHAEKVNTSSLSFSRQTEKRINKVCAFVQQNFHKHLNISDVASLIYLSDSAFCKFFKKATGKTFTQYLNLVRIEAISNQLLYTDFPVYQIVSRYGYDNQTYFNRIFKRVKGVTPIQFRKSIQIEMPQP